MDWREQIPSCFGEADKIFAAHPSDEKRAKDAIRAAKKAGAEFGDFEKEMVWYLYDRAFRKIDNWAHVHEQIKTAKKMWG
jgi:hypothetical protein